MAAIPMRAGRPSLSEKSTYAPIAAREANKDAMTAVTAMFCRAPRVKAAKPVTSQIAAVATGMIAECVLAAADVAAARTWSP
jgi:hypothetical protein